MPYGERFTPASKILTTALKKSALFAFFTHSVINAASMKDEEPNMSLWEENKARRRRQILRAARELISEGGMEALTMRKLGERAQVSVRTIYNLMGSQSDILRAVIARPMSDMIEAVGKIPQNAPFEKLDLVVSVSVDLYCRDPKLFKAAAAASDHLAGYDWHDFVRSQAVPLFKQGIDGAKEEGLLEGFLSSGLLADAIFHGTNKAFADWTKGIADDRTLRVQALSALYLPLLAVATDKAREYIIGKLKSLDTMHADIDQAA